LTEFICLWWYRW